MNHSHPELAGQSNWLEPNAQLISAAYLPAYLARKQALDMYANGATHASIRSSTGINRQKVHYFARRCSKVAPDGVVWGYRALVPYSSVATSSSPGATLKGRTKLSSLFREYPLLGEVLHSLITKAALPGEKSANPHITTETIVRLFAEECARVGVPAGRWPRNALDHGYSPIRRVRLHYLEANDEGAIFHEVGPETAAKIRRSQAQFRTRRRITRPYQRVEVDAHWVDAEFVLLLPTSTPGGDVSISFSGLWIILLIDTYSTTCLGYSLSFSQNYNGFDVTRAVRSAILPWQAQDITIPGVSLPKDSGFPSGLIPEFRYHGIEELHLDNARSHLSDFTRRQLENAIGGTLVYGPAAAPNGRPIVEGFFSKLEANLEQVPSSVRHGGNKNNRAGKIARRSLILESHLVQLLGIQCAIYNSQAAPASDNKRIDILRRYAASNRAIFLRIPASKWDKLRLYDIELSLSVKGSRRMGTAPHVYWEGSKYSSPKFSNHWALIGKTITCLGNSLHVETLDSFDDRGEPLGTFLAESRWRSVPHTINTRRAVNRLRRPGTRLEQPAQDVIIQYTKFLAEQAKTSKDAARQLARIRHESTLGEQGVPAESTSTASTPAKAGSRPHSDCQWAVLLGDLDMM